METLDIYGIDSDGTEGVIIMNGSESLTLCNKWLNVIFLQAFVCLTFLVE